MTRRKAARRRRASSAVTLLRPVGALAGEALDHGRAAAVAEQDEVAHMRRLRRSGAAEMDDLDRTVERRHRARAPRTKPSAKKAALSAAKGCAPAVSLASIACCEQIGPLIQACAAPWRARRRPAATLSSDSSGAKRPLTKTRRCIAACMRRASTTAGADRGDAARRRKGRGLQRPQIGEAPRFLAARREAQLGEAQQRRLARLASANAAPRRFARARGRLRDRARSRL